MQGPMSLLRGSLGTWDDGLPTAIGLRALILSSGRGGVGGYLVRSLAAPSRCELSLPHFPGCRGLH